MKQNQNKQKTLTFGNPSNKLYWLTSTQMN